MRVGSWRRQGRRSSAPTNSAGRSLIETLEGRLLLSSDIGNGYTPAQVITAYGFNQITVGGQQGTGQGQTIAIVAPYDDPNIKADLAVWDTQFGIAAPPSFNIVNQTGGTSLPAGNLAQSDDTAMAVEWTHAFAPQANILLVETNPDDGGTPSNFLAGVQYAASASGVSVVEMSLGVDPWGIQNETFSEFAGETGDDSSFTTPTGHGNVSFVAAAGDSISNLPNWPASSPNVLSVGGTILTTSNNNGDYGSETAWGDNTVGTSAYEAEPSFQSVAENSGKRDVADVSFNAGNNSLSVGSGAQGYDVYNSYFPTATGWESLQGTTAGAAGWAALIAIANQARTNSGLPALDGVNDTLPDLYDLYSPPNTVGFTTYQTYFHDITTGTGATAGYDTQTGLGSPNVPKIETYLGQVPAHTRGGGGGGGGGTGSGGGTGGGGPGSGLNGLTGLGHLPVTQNGGSTGSGSHSGGSHNNSPPPEVLPPVLPSIELSGQFLAAAPTQISGGQSVTLSLQLTNTGSLAFSGPVNLVLSAVDGNSVSTPLKTVRLGKLKISSNGSKTVKFHFRMPTSIATGTYSLEASAIAVRDNVMVLQPLLAGTVSIVETDSAAVRHRHG